MLGSTRLTLVFGAAPDNTSDDAVMKSYVRTLGDAGLAVLFVKPGTKLPDDLRSSQAKKKDVEAGQDKSGLYLATKDKAVLARYVTAYRKRHGEAAPVNLAIHPGRSRYVVIDADTPEEVDAWMGWWAEATDTDTEGIPPTVQTPGAQEEDGTWKHQGGGHWYMALPDGFTIPEGTPAKITVKHGGGQFTAYAGDCYVLIPPSTRPEGRYEMTGTDYAAPQALLDLLVPTERAAKKETTQTPQRQETKAERDTWNDSQEKAVAAAQAAQEVPEGSVSLEDWLDNTPWAEVLGEEWTAYSLDTCGCQTWTAPGVHDSKKSAVTHVCGDHRDGGRLHVWTDNPSTGTPLDDEVAAGTRDFSKLQALTWLHHQGDVLEAMDRQGIDRSQVESHGRLMDPSAVKIPKEKGAAVTSPDDWDDDGPLTDDGASFSIVPIRDLWDMVPPDFIVADTIQDKALTAIIGPSGAGKSFVALDMLCCIVTGMKWQGRDTLHRRVVYVAGEGVSGAIQRVKAWTKTYGHTQEVQDNLLVIQEPVALHDWGVSDWQRLRDQIRETGASLVVLDTWARVTAGMEENSSKEVGHVIKHLDRMRDRTGAGMMVVHHTTRGTTHGRGSTALLGALDSELLVVPGGEDTIEVAVTKQKNAREWGESMIFSLAPVDDSAVLADADGYTGTDRPADHFYRTDGSMETTAALALRMRDLLANRDAIGATKAELATISRRPGETMSAWEWTKVAGEAVSMGVDAGLFVRSEDKGPYFASGLETRDRFARAHHLD